MDSSTENRHAGVSTPNNLSEPKSEISKDTKPKSDTGVSSLSYATSSHGQTSGLREALSLRPPRKGSVSTGEGKSSDGDRKGKSQRDKSTSGGEDRGSANGDKAMSDEHGTGMKNEGTKSGTKVMKEYSAEARTYHAFYDELQRAHLRGHYTWCRDNCLKLLAEPRIPLWTQIQTLQLLSTMLQPAGGEQCLQEADRLIDKLDPKQFQTQLLREDNQKMEADRMAWRIKNDMVGKDIEGVTDEGPSEEQLKLDRDLDEKRRQELELDRELDEKLRQELEEMESVGKLEF